MGILSFIAKARAAEQKLAPHLRASTQTPAGELLTRALNPQEQRALEDAQVLIRRKSLADLKKGRLESVHESNRTGAASGAKRSAEVRAREEPQMFGDVGQTYGYLTDDPFSTLNNRFKTHYPDRGDPYFAPQNPLSHYGQYALELHPENRARTTITLNDSLDRTKGLYASARDILRGDLPQNESVSEGSALWELARQYAARLEPGSNDWLGFQSLLRQHGLEPIGGEGFSARLPRQVPRLLTGLEGSPLMRSELHFLEDPASLKNKLALRDPEYVEAQIHGDITPEHVKRIYDLSYEPSLAAEKAVKKLGIEYVPRPMDTIYDKIKAMNPSTIGELYDLQNTLGVPPERRILLRDIVEPDRVQRENPMLPFKPGFANGGLVSGMTENVDPFRTDAAANPINAHYFADGGQAGDAPGYAEGGEVDLERAAFGIYPRQRATPSSEATKAAAAKTLPGLAADFLIPHDAVDLGLMMLPGGKIARKVGAALIAGGAAGEAEAESANSRKRRPAYAAGGAVEAAGSDPIPYDAAKIQGLVDSLREEMNG